MSFDIDKQPTEIWATYIPSRRPNFKIYNRKGLATSSLYNSGSYYRTGPDERRLYKLEDGKWVEIDTESSE